MQVEGLHTNIFSCRVKFVHHIRDSEVASREQIN